MPFTIFLLLRQRRMGGFVLGDLVLVNKSQADVVKSIEQAMPTKGFYGKRREELLTVSNGALF